MLSGFVPSIITFAIQADASGPPVSSNHFFYVSRFIGALLVATFVPLLIDRRARRSGRTGP
jgi:hypothetical protein